MNAVERIRIAGAMNTASWPASGLTRRRRDFLLWHVWREMGHDPLSYVGESQGAARARLMLHFAYS